MSYTLENLTLFCRPVFWTASHPGRLAKLLTSTPIKVVHVANLQALLIFHINIVGSELLMGELFPMEVIQTNSKLKQDIDDSLAVDYFVFVLEEASFNPIAKGLTADLLNKDS